MSKLKLVMSAAAACFAASGPAWAQQAPAPTQPSHAAPTSNDEIVVRADAGDQVHIDRRIYSIHNDPIAQSTNMFDVLGRIPSVSVAPDGTVSLLGASNVTIQINHQPVPDQSLEQVLRSLQGSDVERIEVISNPSAQFDAAASGGIINIITKQHHAGGLTGAASGTVDSYGSYQANLSPSWTGGPWTLGGRGSYADFRQSQNFTRDRDDFTTSLITHDDGETKADGTFWNGNLQVGYHPDHSHRSTLTYDAFGVTQDVRQTTDRTSTAGPVFNQTSLNVGKFNQSRGVFDYQQDGVPRELLHLNAALSGNSFGQVTTVTLVPAVGLAPAPFLTRYVQVLDVLNVTLDYERPLQGRQFLTTGASFFAQDNDNDIALQTLVGPPGPFDFDNHLKTRQQTLAGYATYQFGFGDWTVLPGLRAEDYRREIVGHGGQTDTVDLRLFPSLHVRRSLVPGLDLDLSYTRRISRPNIVSLDPSERFIDATNAIVGNPSLRPSLTNAFEANLNYQTSNSVYTLTFYDRINSDIVSQTITQQGLVTVSTFVNAGDTEQRGLQAIMRGPLTLHWRYSLQANARQQSFDVLKNGVISRESEFEYDGSAQLEWRDPDQTKIGANDVQLDLRFNGPRQALQQKFDPSAYFNVSWRRRLTDRLFAFAQVQDVFASRKNVYTTNADTFSEHGVTDSTGALLRLSLTYQFGLPVDRPPNAPSDSAAPSAPQ